MIRLFSRSVLVLSVGLALVVLLRGLTPPARGVAQPPGFDIRQPQSPSKPQPPGMTFIDQGQFDPRLKGYRTPAGFRVEIVAAEPAIINPVGMTFGTDGTLYVLEWRPSPGDDWKETPEVITYRDGSKRTIATMRKRVKDVVKVMHFNSQKGTYDGGRVIIEDELPSSILLHDGWIYLTGRGTVRRFRQSRPGGPYDHKEIIARGFCGFHHHQVSGMTIGNDGWLYLTAGDDDNYVEGSDGSRVTVLRTGAVFRCQLDGSRMQVYSIGYRNPYRNLACDTAFNWFHADNDNEDGSKFMGCRLMHVAEATDFGWRLYVGAQCCQADTVRGAVFGELPGRVPPLLKTGRGSPAGLLVYNDTRLPEDYRGLLYYPDVFRKLIRAYRVEPDGATFAVAQEFEFLKSDDPLFRPCQMVAGPDGAMYVCDWRTNSGGAGRLSGDGVHGRIYRISWVGTADQPALPLRGMDSWLKVVRGSDAELVAALAAPDFSDRQVAQRELVHRGERNRPALLALLADLAKPWPARLAALGALESFWNGEVQAAFVKMLDDASPDVRRLACDGLSLNAKAGDVTVHDALLNRLGDHDLAVRRAAALAIGRINAPSAADALVAAYQFDDGRDVYLSDGLLRAIERTGEPGVRRLVGLAESGSEQGRDKCVAAFRATRTRPAAELLPRLLENPHLSIRQRTDLVRSYANYELDPPLSLSPLVAYLRKEPDEDATVKQAALDIFALPGLAPGARLPELLRGWLDESNPQLRLAVIRAVAENRVTTAGPKLVAMLADTHRPAAERLALVRALRAVGEKTAVPLLRSEVSAKPAGAAAVSFQIEALRTLAALDAKAAAIAARAWLAEGPEARQAEAVAVLTTQPAGAKLAAERYLAGQLPKELLLAVTEGVRRHTAREPSLKPLLAKLLHGSLVIATDRASLERIKQLVAAQGDPIRGRDLYLKHKGLACITCHKMEGVGGQVGPDLTRIWETQSLEKLVESIVQPSKEIKEGYQTYIAATTAGLTYTGLKISESATEVVLKEATGREVHIPKSELEELRATKTSLMPENAVALLTFEQFLDLLAFLKDRHAQESLKANGRRQPAGR